MVSGSSCFPCLLSGYKDAKTKALRPGRACAGLQSRLLRGIFGAGEDWGVGNRADSIGPTAPGWISPAPPGWETHPANGYVSIVQLWGTSSDLTHLLPCPRRDWGLGKRHIAHITLPVVCSLPMQAFLLWDSPVAASVQEQYCESLLPVTNHTGECPASPAHPSHPQGTPAAGMVGRGCRGVPLG